MNSALSLGSFRPNIFDNLSNNEGQLYRITRELLEGLTRFFRLIAL